MIVDPITMAPHQMVYEAIEMMTRYRISGIPITEGPKLVGILTNRDLRFVTNTQQPIAALMTKDNLVTVAQGTSLDEAQKLLHQHRIEKLLVVDEAFHLQGHWEARKISAGVQRCLGAPARGRRGRPHP